MISRCPDRIRPRDSLTTGHILNRLCKAAVLASLVGLGGCLGDHADVTGSIAAAPLPSNTANLRDFAATWGDRHKADPGNKTAALNYAQALRALTQFNQAVAVLEASAIKSPTDPDILAAYGKALADAGRFKEASDVLARAQTPENPNWSTLSAQGSVADQLGEHDDAQAYYAAALKIKPGDPHVLSNLGLSYALTNKLPEAEQTMREAAAKPEADMRVRQNLALVLALKGSFAEAEQVAQRDLSPADANASVASIRGMIAQSNTWQAIQRNAGAPKKKAASLAQADIQQ